MSKRIIILGVAVIAAGAAGYLAMNMVSQPPAEQQVTETRPAIELDQVLVADQNLSTGEVLDGQLRWQDWPVASLSPDFITKSIRPDAISELQGSVVRATVAQGEPIRPIKLLGPDQSFMSSILPSGKRAVATQIAADTSAGGFILPDDYVDVIMTSRPPSRGGGYITETILENIRVLAIDQTIREDEQGRLVQADRRRVVGLTVVLLGPALHCLLPQLQCQRRGLIVQPLGHQAQEQLCLLRGPLRWYTDLAVIHLVDGLAHPLGHCDCAPIPRR